MFGSLRPRFFILCLLLTSAWGWGAKPGDVEKGGEETPRLNSSQIQLMVMDFSDQYAAGLWAVMDAYIAGEKDSAKKVQAQSFKVRLGAASMEIAGSTDPRTNLLDMAIFISVGKWAVNRYWIPKVFGEKAEPLSDLYAEQEKKVWKLLEDVLAPKQLHSLRELVTAWEKENPSVYEVATVRLRNLEGVRAGEFDPTTSAKGILAGVQKLLGRVDTSLLYGERMMFFLERTPRLLTQQTDLTLAQIADTFPIATIRPETFPGLSADWPTKLQEGIDHNHALAKDLLPEIRLTIDSADRLSTTLNGTLVNVQNIVAKVPPMTVEDVSRNLQEINKVLDHLDSTVAGVNQILEKNPDGISKAVELSQMVDQRADRLVNAAFSRALILLGVFFAGIIVVLIAARLIFPRKGT